MPLFLEIKYYVPKIIDKLRFSLKVKYAFVFFSQDIAEVNFNGAQKIRNNYISIY